MRILHVTECYAGGVSRAIEARVLSLPNYEHHLLWCGDGNPSEGCSYESIRELPQGFARRVAAIRRAITEIEPDLVHAHSSWAGVYARMLRVSVPIVYESHCFKFDDPNSSTVARKFYYLAEKILSKNTAAFGALSEHEMNLCMRLNGRVPTVVIPNTPSVPIQPRSETKATRTPKVAMSGRISAQKDPAFFIAIIEELRCLGVDVDAVWLGDGDASGRVRLVSHGIRVTGWLDKEALMTELKECSVYVHSAAYEGFPLSVLDAAAMGVPIVARRIPAFQSVRILQGDTPEELAVLVRSVMGDVNFHRIAMSANEHLLDTMNSDSLAAALERVYAIASH